jgi:hypothetical protein
MIELIILGVIAYSTFMLAKDVMYIGVILVGAYLLFMRQKVESLENTKECSQNAINKGHLDYTFSTPKFVR